MLADHQRPQLPVPDWPEAHLDARLHMLDRAKERQDERDAGGTPTTHAELDGAE